MNIECQHCKTLSENTNSSYKCPLTHAMESLRECDCECQQSAWKAEDSGNPCETAARMRFVIASETPKKQNTLWECSKNANLECQHRKTTAKMHFIFSNAMESRRECDC